MLASGEAAGGAAFGNVNPAIVRTEDGGWRVLVHYDTMNNPTTERCAASEAGCRNRQIWSDDGGETWSDFTDIMDFFPPESRGCMHGPAIGVQNTIAGHPAVNTVYFN